MDTAVTGHSHVKLPAELIDELMVRPGEPARLDERSTAGTRTRWLEGSDPKHLAEKDLEAFTADLSMAQELLFATETYALLVILQAPDAAGKDGTIKHVMSGVNPQGCDVVSFKQPSSLELEHDFLWRCAKDVPARGRIGIFNRSYYEEVLVTRVHAQVLANEKLPPGAPKGEMLWVERFDDINAFEHHLERNGTRIVKLFLHVSEQVQRKRLLERLEDPSKFYKFSRADLAERAYFSDYRKAYDEAITATSTGWAPWYVVPADHKYALRVLVGGILVHTIQKLDLSLPRPGPQMLAEIESAKRELKRLRSL